jgi:hypothetical protein
MSSDHQTQLDLFFKDLIIKTDRTPLAIVELCQTFGAHIPVMKAFAESKAVAGSRLSDAFFDQCERQPHTCEGKVKAKQWEEAGEWATQETDLQRGYAELKWAVLDFMSATKASGIDGATAAAWLAAASLPAETEPVTPVARPAQARPRP